MGKVIIILGWLLCGLIGAGFTNAYFTRKYDNCKGREELGFALSGAVFGPIALIGSFLHSGFGQYGWSLFVLQNPNCVDKIRNY